LDVAAKTLLIELKRLFAPAVEAEMWIQSHGLNQRGPEKEGITTKAPRHQDVEDAFCQAFLISISLRLGDFVVGLGSFSSLLV
jgi:hypothetical protein